MLSVRFGRSIDMTDDDSLFDLLYEFGEPQSILSNSATQLVLLTDTGNTLTITGQIDISSERALLNSTLTGMTFRGSGGNLLMSITGVENQTFGSIDDGSGESRLNAQIRAGISVTGSSAGDVLVGDVGADVLNGGSGNDELRGAAGNDRITGGNGNDILNGGGGNDAMSGGAGDDRYYVNASGDSVSESSGAGRDRVYSSISFTLPANVEELFLQGSGNLNGTGNGQANTLSGNSGRNTLLGQGGGDTLLGQGGNDRLEGGAGNDRLDGGGGSDTLIGGAGNDSYVVDRGTDRVTESSGQGRDTVLAGVTFRLPNHVENLQLTGGNHSNGTGNAQANVLTGNGGNNVLNGAGGNDTIHLGAGVDTAIGGGGADRFVFATELDGVADVLQDFQSGVDQLRLDDLLFDALAPGAPGAGQFILATDTPAGGDDYLVYDQAAGLLYYDATGGGATDTLFASLGAGTALTAADFLVI